MAQRIALLTTLFVVVPAVGTARADWQTDRAQAIAARLWHDPCGGAVTLLSQPPPSPDWRAWTFPDRCTVVLSNTRPWTWHELCPVVMHEYGHLAGYSDPLNPGDPYHSHDPRDLMAPFEHYDHRCDSYGAAIMGDAAGGVGRAAKRAHRAMRARRVRQARQARHAQRARRARRAARRR
jgi:hypothetical protein